jgi:hypothetical protein
VRKFFEAAGAKWLSDGTVAVGDLEIEISPVRTGAEVKLAAPDLDPLEALRKNRAQPLNGPHFVADGAGVVLRAIATLPDLLDPLRLRAVLDGCSGRPVDTDARAAPEEATDEWALFPLEPINSLPEPVQQALGRLLLLRDGVAAVPGRHHRLYGDIWSVTLAQPVRRGSPGRPALEEIADRERELLTTVSGSAAAVRHLNDTPATERRSK